MKFVFSGASVFTDGRLRQKDFIYHTGVSSTDISVSADLSGYFIFPGFTDVHVHFREPGFSYKETIATGSAAAARGGYTAVCTMPNLAPTPDSLENLRVQTDIISRDATVKIIPFGTITKGEKGTEVSDMEALAPYVCGFSDDGYGVGDPGIMREAMIRARSLDKVISAHCEDTTCEKDSPESEWREIERNIRLAEETGCRLHICHISTKESVRLIRSAKKSCVDVTCETAPHYLTLTADCISDNGKYRMNPPLRGKDDRDALLDGIADGTVDMIATDHAPHSAEEKSRGFAGSLNGIVGLETAFAQLYTRIVGSGVITLERLIEMMSVAPNRRFGIKTDGFTIFDLNDEYIIEPNRFASMGRSTPFEGQTVRGRCLMTVCGGAVVYKDKDFQI